MGNQPSSSRSNPQSPNGPPQAHQHGPTARRRESIQTLSIKASGLSVPTASFESAAAHPPAPIAEHAASSSSSTGTAPFHANAHALTTAPAVLSSLQQAIRYIASDEKMGNEQSRHRSHGQGHGRDQVTQPTPPKAKAPTEKTQTQTQTQPLPTPSPQTKPVDVPSLPKEESQASRTEAISSVEAPDATLDYPPPQSQFTRPPRLPLPIDETDITPGSPIISPADLAPLDIGDVDGVLPRRTGSVLSHTTAEDDDVGDDFHGPQNVPTVPTLIEWEGPGERIYVTGTFAGWNRKYKLHRNGPSQKKNVLSAIVNIAPGTHHLKFIVDNDMRTSDKLPTAVDYTNILVNYLEVSYDDVPKPDAPAADETKKPEPVPVQEQPAPPGIFPPLTLPPTPELQPVKPPVVEPPKPKVRSPSPKRYHSSIPRYLVDLDAPETSSKFARANAAASDLPTPPTLPMFLSKSILNGVTPMQDDSSVLLMPNHTVLNHLATSSIKDNILATSATTRYKQKFLTTIMYKPKNEDSDRGD